MTENVAVRIRAILDLVRPAYIPTVLSNCLAGWWLGGGHNTETLLVVLAGAALVFTGGALLHNLFNLSFDRRHRRERAISLGTIKLRLVWRAGLLLLVAGTLILQIPGRLTGGLAMALALAVVVHNSSHRLLPFSPGFEGCCRLLLYLMGASIAGRGITGVVIWCAIACALYATGLRSLIRQPLRKGQFWWQVPLLLSPIAFGVVMNTGPYVPALAGLIWLVLLWTLFVGWLVLWQSPSASRVAVAGITLVDMLAACPAPPEAWISSFSEERHMAILFLGLFGCSLVLGLLKPRTGQHSTPVPQPERSTTPALPN